MARIKATLTVGTICAGSCKRPLRPNATTLAEAPGTTAHSKDGKCLTCRRNTGTESLAQRKERLLVEAAGGEYTPLTKRGNSRDLSTLLLCVSIDDAAAQNVRAKVGRWFPGDTQLLEILGLAA